jgi:hypothetical protein
MLPEQRLIVSIAIWDICNISTCRCSVCVRAAALTDAGPIVAQRHESLPVPPGVKGPSPHNKVMRDE